MDKSKSKHGASAWVELALFNWSSLGLISSITFWKKNIAKQPWKGQNREVPKEEWKGTNNDKTQQLRCNNQHVNKENWNKEPPENLLVQGGGAREGGGRGWIKIVLGDRNFALNPAAAPYYKHSKHSDHSKLRPLYY